jgi:serine protease AprX
LLQLAAQQPEATLGVIVQKLSGDSRVESLVDQLGGRVTADLRIINGFAAELPAKAVVALAQAEGVRWVSYDAPVERTACSACVDTSVLANAYIRAIRADKVWNSSPYLQGQSIGVAVVDSGVNPQEDLFNMATGVNRLVASVAFNEGYNQTTTDAYDHGSHVAGIIGGNGFRSRGKYIGVAPKVNLINVKVSDDTNLGAGTARSVVQGLQWILDNRTKYNIRVVNISINSAVAESYHTNPIDAAVEILWFNRIVVVASAGNRGSGAIYPPANDPFIITVGAADDKGTASLSDDVVASFSAYGKTSDGFAKPDLVAPGRNIVSLIGTGAGLWWLHPENQVDPMGYFKMSGTSMAAPMVAAAAALLLQDEPKLTPDQVKYRLKATANKSWAGYNSSTAGAGYLDVYAAVTGTTTQSANTNITASKLLWSGSQPVTWSSVNWNSVNWNSVNWNSVNWNSVNWNSVNWNSDYWGK